MSALLPAKGAPRLLALATLVNMTGYGIHLAAGVLYFTRVVHLSPGQIGIGLSLAGAVALLTAMPIGHLADRLGARGVFAVTLVVGALALAGLGLADDFGTFLVLAALVSIAQTSGPAASGPLIQEYGGDRPAEFRGYLRSVTNLGIAAGALLAGWGVQLDTRNAYLLLIAGSALSYAVCAAMVAFLPSVPARPPGAGPRWLALRDRPYLLLTVLDGLMAVQYRVLPAAVPLWLVSRTDAPHWVVSAVLLVNTAIVVLLQVRAGRGVDTPARGALAFRRAGYAFFVSCALISLLGHVPTWVVLVLLAVAVAVHTLGEIWQAAGGFELSFALAPAHAVGQYQGVFGMGLGVGLSIGPAVLIALCVEWGAPGWWLVGTLFALIGLAVPPTVRWAERRSEPDLVLEMGRTLRRSA